MTVGTIVVVGILALIVGAIIYRWIKAQRAGVNPHCSSCDCCSGCSLGSGSDDAEQ